MRHGLDVMYNAFRKRIRVLEGSSSTGPQRCDQLCEIFDEDGSTICDDKMVWFAPLRGALEVSEKSQEDRDPIDGLRHPARSVRRTPDYMVKSAQVRNVFDDILGRQPAVQATFLQAIGDSSK